MNIWKKYVKDVKVMISQEKIDNANFRSKVKGWVNFYIVVDGKLSITATTDIMNSSICSSLIRC